MSKLSIRIPVVLEVLLTDSDITDLASRIREDDGREDDAKVTNDEIKHHLVDYANDDFDSFMQDHTPDTHVDEGAASVKEVKD